RAAETGGLHPPPEQGESKIEVTRIVRVETKEGHRRSLQLLRRRSCLGGGRVPPGAQRRKRGVEHPRVDRFLRLEMKVERGRRVPGANRDRPQARAFQPILGEDLLRGLQNELTLVSADRRAPALPLLDHPHPRASLDSHSNSVKKSNTV